MLPLPTRDISAGRCNCIDSNIRVRFARHHQSNVRYARGRNRSREEVLQALVARKRLPADPDRAPARPALSRPSRRLGTATYAPLRARAARRRRTQHGHISMYVSRSDREPPAARERPAPPALPCDGGRAQISPGRAIRNGATCWAGCSCAQGAQPCPTRRESEEPLGLHVRGRRRAALRLAPEARPTVEIFNFSPPPPPPWLQLWRRDSPMHMHMRVRV